MKALLTGLKTALFTMNRLKAYLEYLPTLPATRSRANLEVALVEIHAHILQFLARAIRIYQKGSLSRAFDVFWKPDEINNFEKECDRIAARAEIEASNCDRTLSAQEREEASRRKEHLQRALEELEELRGIGRTINTLAGKLDLARLPSVDGAAFDSYQDELDARCHPDTRIDLLRQINDWATDQQGRCIFWLNGMAGTGKSTISRTVAQTFADAGRLGASFFFKRGEGERGNASRFFTTIATQLVYTVPAIIPYLSEAIDADPGISGKLMKEQFRSLILHPLSEAGRHSATLIERMIVIDALDECEREGDIRNILHLLSQTQHLDSIHLRIFLTSRPELPIRLGFKTMSAGVHQDVILQEITKDTIKYDITSFLKAEFQKIRDDHNNSRLEELILPEGWPGERNIQALSKMAVPLFIFAATVSRFVGDLRWNPKKRLETVLRYQLISQASKLDQTYLPVLDNLIADLSESEKNDLAQEFRAVVGSIIVLAEPLGTSPLARLLKIDKGTIDCRLDPLHSVLSIPSSPDVPIRLLHLSFREFLLDPDKREKSLFWVDERERHDVIGTKCLELMSGHLKENICHLEFPGRLREDIDPVIIQGYLPVDVRYACRYWIYHVVESKRSLRDHGAVHCFLETKFLHWLEALSLIGRISDSVGLIGSLQSAATVGSLTWFVRIDKLTCYVQMNKSTQLSLFLSDARRFILMNSLIIQKAPLQLYSSAIIFTPQESVIRNTFEKPIPWISRLPKVPRAWTLELQKLEGHSDHVNAVAFSSDDQLLASASSDHTIRLWSPATGEQVQLLEGHNNIVRGIAFSADGQLLASASYDKTVRLWDPVTGDQVELLEGHSDYVNAVAFSANGQLLASASEDKTVRLWNPATGERVGQLEGHSEAVPTVAFSMDGQLLASASHDKTVRLWNPATGEQVQLLKGHMDMVTAVAFSTDGKLLASSSHDQTVRLWNLATGEQVQLLQGPSEFVNAVSLSSDGQLLVSASFDNTLRLWNPATGEQLQQLEGHCGNVGAVAFSNDGQLLASAYEGKTVRLWNPSTSTQVQQLEGHSTRVLDVVFSSDCQLLASVASRDKIVRLWDPATGEQVQQLEGHRKHVCAVAFSTDGQLLASGSWDNTVRLWNPATGEQMQQLEGHSEPVNAVAFSADGQLLASASSDETVRLWNLATGEQVQLLEGHSDFVNDVVFSSDGQLLASASDDNTIRLWNPATGEQVQLLEGHSDEVAVVAISSDGQLLASASEDRTVRLWNPATGEQLQQLEYDNVEDDNINYDKLAIRQLNFSDDSRCLDTDRGLLQLHFDQSERRWLMSQISRHIFLDEDWINCDNKNLLWLPADYRGGCFAWKCNVLAIGQNSGQVHFFHFNT
jgi:WD40 repeat protein